MIRALIYDIGNVLVRTEDLSPRRAWEHKLQLAHDAIEPLVHATELNSRYERGELDTAQFWSLTGTNLGIPESQLDQFRADFYAGDHLNSEMMAFIRARRLAGLKTAIISNAPKAMRTKLRDELEILDDFDVVTISGEVGVRKPAASIFAACCAALRIAANETIFVDDIAENCEGARAAGLHAVHFMDNPSAMQAIERLIAAP